MSCNASSGKWSFLIIEFVNLNGGNSKLPEKKRYTAEQKVIILRELLENNASISQVAEKYQVHVNDIYNWKKKLFENASSIFESGSGSSGSVQEKKIETLEAKLKKKDDTIKLASFRVHRVKTNLDGEI